MSNARQKHEREAVRMAKSLHPKMHAEIETRGSINNSHKWLEANLEGTTARVVIASSPTTPDLWIRQVRGNLIRAFRKQGVELPDRPENKMRGA